MTLSTNILVVDPVPARALFDHAVGLLASDPTVTVRPLERDLTVRPEHVPADAGWWRPQCGWRTVLGQGLAAICEVTYGPDGPLDYLDGLYTADETIPADEADADWRRYCVQVWFDTAYSYRGPGGGRCSDLHAWLIREVGAWLDDRGVRWWWNIDTYGEFRQGPVPVEWGDADRGNLAVGVAR